MEQKTEREWKSIRCPGGKGKTLIMAEWEIVQRVGMDLRMASTVRVTISSTPARPSSAVARLKNGQTVDQVVGAVPKVQLKTKVDALLAQ